MALTSSPKGNPCLSQPPLEFLPSKIEYFNLGNLYFNLDNLEDYLGGNKTQFLEGHPEGTAPFPPCPAAPTSSGSRWFLAQCSLSPQGLGRAPPASLRARPQSQGDNASQTDEALGALRYAAKLRLAGSHTRMIHSWALCCGCFCSVAGLLLSPAGKAREIVRLAASHLIFRLGRVSFLLCFPQVACVAGAPGSAFRAC